MPKKKPRTAEELHGAILAVADREIAVLEAQPELDNDDLGRMERLERFVVHRLSDEREAQALALKDKTEFSRAEAIEIVRGLLESDPEVRAIAAQVLSSHASA